MYKLLKSISFFLFQYSDTHERYIINDNITIFIGATQTSIYSMKLGRKGKEKQVSYSGGI